MIISNEVKMLCAKNMEAAEGGVRLCDYYQWDALWDKMLAEANIFEKIYMIHQGHKGIKVRTKAQVMSACINGFTETSTKTLAKAAPVQKVNPIDEYVRMMQESLNRQNIKSASINQDSYRNIAQSPRKKPTL